MSDDLYKRLGVSENADSDAIKKAYRKLTRELHPDTNPDNPKAEEQFKEVQEAYGILSDDRKKRQYDRMRRFGGAGQDPFRTRTGGKFYQNSDGTYVRMDQTEFDPGAGFGDIFERFFGSAAGDQAEPRGRSGATEKAARVYDRKRTVRISFSRMLKGGKITFSLDGEKLSIPFPKGVKDGHQVRIRSKGRPMPNGGSGNLYVTIRVEDHPDFVREEMAVHTNLEVSAFDAMLGTGTQIKTPHGKRLKLNIPAGSQPGERLRIRGHGVETESKKGDLIVHLDIQIPVELTAEQKEWIEKARSGG